MLNDNEVYCTIINWMLADASNKKYKDALLTIKSRIEGKKHIEQLDHPKNVCIELFGWNCLFPFRIDEYRNLALLLTEEKL